MASEAVLIVVVMAGQAILHADAVVVSWERCSELALQLNADDGVEDGVYTTAFCREADNLLIGNWYWENER